MRGLDPLIHHLHESLSNKMDCRERRQVYVVCARQTTMPGNDGLMRAPLSFLARGQRIGHGGADIGD